MCEEADIKVVFEGDEPRANVVEQAVGILVEPVDDLVANLARKVLHGEVGRARGEERPDQVHRLLPALLRSPEGLALLGL